MAYFCEKWFPEILTSNEEYIAKNYDKALLETFVEIDWMLLSDEGQEKLR